ncbi:apolipoprotein A-I-like [Varanus komodoensis]|uniref:apolipoprotein A-I-like n=1 Tax=Varanus komodoensis TaxID=61221 RepID=UPI001CF7B59E|nr:apolipoprotein A-I-like [Varanus komodoensis]
MLRTPLLLLLALALFGGFQASFLSDEAPTLHLERFCDTIQDYLDKISKATGDNMEPICSLELSKEINTRIRNGIHGARSYPGKLPLALALQRLLRDVAKELQGLRSRVQPYADDLNQKVQGGVSSLQEHLAPVAGELLEQVELQVQALQEAVASGTKELRQKVEALRTQLGPLVQELNGSIEQRVQDFQQGMGSLAQQLQGRPSWGVQQARHNWYPYAEDLQIKDLQEKVTSV